MRVPSGDEISARPSELMVAIFVHVQEGNERSVALRSNKGAAMKMKNKVVRDIMNPKILYVLDGQQMSLVRTQIVRYGVTGVPVLDVEHKPVGFISLCDLPAELSHGHYSEDDLERADGDSALAHAGPPFTIGELEPIEEAARRLARSDHQQAVVVRADGVAVGVVAAIDFLRALTHIPSRHPPRFADENNA
jgi:CBS domain-containing protein